MLLADPGVTGARAVAETLDKPTILEMGMRRLLWQAACGEILEHVIDRPRSRRRAARCAAACWSTTGAGKHTTLAGGSSRTLEFTWPPLADLDPVKLVEAIVAGRRHRDDAAAPDWCGCSSSALGCQGRRRRDRGVDRTTTATG